MATDTAPPIAARTPEPRSARLRGVALLFTRLGFTAFGGPAAHIAMMEDEVVRRRGWLSRAEFLDLVGAVNLIPGPNSTEIALHVGHRRAGFAGLLVAGACFIGPAMGMALVLAWVYQRYGTLPRAAGVLAGIKPVIIAVVVQAVWSLGRTALRTRTLTLLALAAGAMAAMGVGEIAVLALGAGAGAAARAERRRDEARFGAGAGVGVGAMAVATGVAAGAASVTLPAIFGVFLKIGSLLFGSGYVLASFMRTELVERRGWLSEGQVLDAVAVGQFTPGPLLTTATFAGSLLAGVPGGLAATAGIFLPAFVLVALSGPLVPRLRRSATAGAVLDGVNAASWALMAVAAWRLGRGAVVDWATAALAVVAAMLLARFRVNSAWLVLGGGLIGLARGGG